MIEDLQARVEASRQAALNRGTVIKLRKEDVLKSKLIGKGNKFTYKWYQTPSKIGIQIPFIVQRKEDLLVKFTEDRLIIKFPIAQGGKYDLDLILFKRIVPERSKTIHGLNKIEIVMEKLNPSQTWSFLRRDGLGIPQGQQAEENLYPTNAKVKKNWSKIDRDIEEDILKHGAQFGEDPTLNFFKQIYGNGDEEKRRAMIKSFQSSGGTALSTDWKDVSKKDYQGKDKLSPPKGQQWRKRQI